MLQCLAMNLRFATCRWQPVVVGENVAIAATVDVEWTAAWSDDSNQHSNCSMLISI